MKQKINKQEKNIKKLITLLILTGFTSSYFDINTSSWWPKNPFSRKKPEEVSQQQQGPQPKTATKTGIKAEIQPDWQKEMHKIFSSETTPGSSKQPAKPTSELIQEMQERQKSNQSTTQGTTQTSAQLNDAKQSMQSITNATKTVQNKLNTALTQLNNYLQKQTVLTNEVRSEFQRRINQHKDMINTFITTIPIIAKNDIDEQVHGQNQQSLLKKWGQ